MYRMYMFAASITFISQVLATCYLPNGNPVEVMSGKEVNQPCNTTAGVHSMCCLLDSPTPNTCNPDGLCIPYKNGFIYRDTCTDPTWEDPACLKICTTGQSSEGGNLANETTALTTCADGSYCCGESNRACCLAHQGVFVQNGRVVSLRAPDSSTSNPTSSTTATSGQSSPQASTNPIPAVPATPTPNPTSSNTGPIVGGVVGGMAGITTLALTFWYFVLRRKSIRLQDQLPRQHYEGIHTERQNIWQEPKEVAADDIRREMGSEQARQELEGQ